MAQAAGQPEIQHDHIEVLYVAPTDLSKDLIDRSDCYAPPVDVELWVAIIAGDVILADSNPRQLEEIVDDFMSS